LVVLGGLSKADSEADAEAGIAPIAISEPVVTADNAARAASRTNTLPDIMSSTA
jgi:thiamine monophosphate synthase